MLLFRQMNLAKYLTTTSQYLFAKDLGVSQGLVSQWLLGKTLVSPKKCVFIEQITNGAVTRQDLRPNDYWEYWPELAPPSVDVPPIPDDCKESVPVLRSSGRFKDDRAIAQFFSLSPPARVQLFNKTPLSEKITESLCIKARRQEEGVRA